MPLKRSLGLRVFTCLKIAIGLIALPDFGHAACAPNMTTLVSCTANAGGKALDLCADGRHVLYRYGDTGASPEIELIMGVAEVGYTPWPGVSSSIWESVTLTNGAYSYEVYSSIARDPSKPEVSGGVEVLLHSKRLATVACDAGSTVTEIDGLYDMREAAGLCYDHSAFAWGDCAQ